jgi:hypothetical protein
MLEYNLVFFKKNSLLKTILNKKIGITIFIFYLNVAFQ